MSTRRSRKRKGKQNDPIERKGRQMKTKENEVQVDLSVLANILTRTEGHWVPIEKTEVLPHGGELTIRGFACDRCGFFRRKRFGKSKFCEDCGSIMKGGN